MTTRTKFRRSWIAATLALGMYALSSHAAPRVIDVRPGGSEDAYFEVNISGTVYVRIGVAPKPEGQEACADFWWIKWPFGNIEPLGRHCGTAKFEIPGITKFAISSKLRVGGAKNQIKVAIFAEESVANSFTFAF